MPKTPGHSNLTRRGFLKGLAGFSGSGSAPELPASSRITFDTPVLTPVGKFFRQSIRTSQGAPTVDLTTWTLHISGLVDTPRMLSYAELRSLPALGETRALVCMGDVSDPPLIGNAVWRGCALDDLLGDAGVKAAATRIRFDSADGYQTSLPLSSVMGRGALLAYEMNGAVLPPEHGFPVRLLMPGRYGTKSPKWLTGISLVADDHRGFWEGAPHFWSDEALVKTRAHILYPAPYAEVELGAEVALQGVAFAGVRRITAVEVSIDDSSWMPATLRLPGSPHEWTQWYVTWIPQIAGDAQVSVRAIDEAGFTQHRRAGRFDAFPDGSDAIHNILLRIV